MSTSDRKRFNEKLVKVGVALGRRAEPEKLDVLWDVLRGTPIDALLAAIDAHLRDPKRGMEFPTPADIVRHLPTDPRTTHVSADEAWAIALKAADEKNTVVWSVEIQCAWATCEAIMQQGDAIGARMAFRSAYERLITEAKAMRKPPSWHVSLGWDLDQRKNEIEQAKQLGRLTTQQAQIYLPSPVDAHDADAKRAKQKMSKMLSAVINAR